MNTIVRRRFLIALTVIFVSIMAVGVPAQRVAAHPLGNFTVNQYSRIEVTTDGPRLVYVLDLAEIPAFQEIQRADADGDGAIDDAEGHAYLTAKLAEITPSLRFTVDGQPVPLAAVEREVTFPEGQAGLKLVRLRAVFAPATEDTTLVGAVSITFQNDYAVERLGWREIVVTHGANLAVEASDAPATDASDELRAYPEDMLGSSLDRTAAAFRVIASPGAPAAPGFAAFATRSDTGQTAARPDGGTSGARFAALVGRDDLSVVGIAVALLGAMLWGAAHALSPGHGKTVVGAYLVGSRGTPRHAAFLGLTVTVTHTAGVIALGLVTLFASRFILPEQLFPWLGVASGLLVVAMGLVILRLRLRGQRAHHHHHHAHDHDHDHDHGHSHLPPGVDGGPITWRALLALGVSGGIIPCPSALVALLGAIALGRAGIGLALVLAFSVGLAGTLTGVGLLFLSAGRIVERRALTWRWLGPVLRYAPAAGAMALTLAGVAILVRALGEIGLL